MTMHAELGQVYVKLHTSDPSDEWTDEGWTPICAFGADWAIWNEDAAAHIDGNQPARIHRGRSATLIFLETGRLDQGIWRIIFGPKPKPPWKAAHARRLRRR